MDDSGPPFPRPVPLQQHEQFAAALAACGQVTLRPGGPSGPLAMLRRLPGGLPIAMISRAGHPAGDLRRIVMDSALARVPLLLGPDAPAPDLREIGAVPLMTPATVAELDLRPEPEALRAGLHPKWRNRLGHAERQGLRVAREGPDGSARRWLFRAEAEMQARRGYRTWPLALILAYGAVNPGQCVIFTARERGDTVAATLLLRHGGAATYQIGQTSARGRALSAHTLLLWEAMLWLRAEGHSRLDLGSIDMQRGAGLARFKLGTGAELRRLGGTWGWWPPLGRSLGPLARLDLHRM